MAKDHWFDRFGRFMSTPFCDKCLGVLLFCGPVLLIVAVFS